jgi:anaerobic ribonucleoside-triphosphate reductase
MNMNRLIQKDIDIGEQVDKIHKYQIAYRKIMDEFKDAKLLPVYDAGFITLDKQYLTLGINGMVEAAEFKGIKVGNNDEYKSFCTETLKIIYARNKAKKAETGYMFNTEFVPAENLGVKNAKWDKKDGLVVNRDCYNSYFYIVEDESCDVADKFVLHGEQATKFLDGGSALHLNLDDYLTKEQYRKMFNASAAQGCNYFCVNVKVTVCNDCGHIHKKTLDKCVVCGSEDIAHATRVIGYLKKVTSFSKPRQVEHKERHYHEEALI